MSTYAGTAASRNGVGQGNIPGFGMCAWEDKTGPLLRNTEPCVAETGEMGPCSWLDLPETQPDGRITDMPGPRFPTRSFGSGLWEVQ